MSAPSGLTSSKYRKRPVVIEAHQWLKMGDHPGDGCLHVEARDEPINEGKVVRYFRHPDTHGNKECEYCSRTMMVHGWIDTKEGGHIVCPGDWIITGVQGEQYPCKPDIFAATYEPASLSAQAVDGAEQEPVAYVMQAHRDGSIGSTIAPTNYMMFEKLMAKLKDEPWVKAGAASIVPLYTSPLAQGGMAEGWRERLSDILDRCQRNVNVGSTEDMDAYKELRVAVSSFLASPSAAPVSPPEKEQPDFSLPREWIAKQEAAEDGHCVTAGSRDLPTPSCFICGHVKPREQWARTHLAYPDIYACADCVPVSPPGPDARRSDE